MISDRNEELAQLEGEMKAAMEAETTATKAAAVATETRTKLQKRLLKARTEAAKSSVSSALDIEREELDGAISQASERIRSATGVIAVAGAEHRWPSWLEKALSEANEKAVPGEIPAAVLVRGVSATGRQDDGVCLILDMTGRLPKPASGLSADDHARRVRARQGM